MIALIPAALLLLAGRASAVFNATVGGMVLEAKDVLNLDYGASAWISDCASTCNEAQGTLNACNNDALCLCSDATVAAFLGCQQCMFTNLIKLNKPMPDMRAGSTPLLQAYAAGCADPQGANKTLAKTQISLAVPPTWDGPFGMDVPTPLMALTVIVGTGMVGGSLVLLSNM